MKATAIKGIVILLILIRPVAAFCQQEERIAELSTSKFRWFINKEYDSLQGSLGDNVMYVHSNGWIQNEKDLIEDLKSGKITYNNVTVHESKVRVYGNTGVLIGKGTFNVAMNDNDVSIELLFTEVYVREKGKWKLVSRHANKL